MGEDQKDRPKSDISELTDIIELALMKAAIDPDTIFIDQDYAEIDAVGFRGDQYLITIKRMN